MHSLARGLMGLGVICLAAPSQAQTRTDLQGTNPPAHALWLQTLGLSKMTTGYNTAQAGKSIDGNPLTLGGTVYPHGVGVDDEKKGAGSVTFTVLVDGKRVAQTGILRGGDAPVLLSVDLTGAQGMVLKVGDGDDGISSDHADWAGAEITLTADDAVWPVAEVIPPAPVDPPHMTFPTPNPRPTIHGPQVIGATPHRPFLFLVSATGAGPLRYGADGLSVSLPFPNPGGAAFEIVRA